MQVHKLIELLNGLVAERKLPLNISKIIIEKLFKSEKFEFDFGEFPNECKTVEEFDELVKQTKLPFPLCFFEIPNFGSVLAYHSTLNPKLIKLQVFYYNIKKQWSLLDPADQVVIDLINGTINTTSPNPEIQTLYNDENSKEIKLTAVIINLVIRGLSVLNCSNVICLDNEPSKALNKKRIKNGKVPLFSYKTLHIKTPVFHNGRPNLGGTHASPRLHLRRGHIRKYATYSIWINNMVVGNSRKGIVLKDYKIT